MASEDPSVKAVQVKLVLLGELGLALPVVECADACSFSSFPLPCVCVCPSPPSTLLATSGEAAVGKSSLVLRFVQNDFNENTSPTIGAAFLTQSELPRARGPVCVLPVC